MSKEVLEFDYQINYIIIGNPSVGKSNILLRYVKNDFKNRYEVTLGVDFGFKKIQIDDIIFKVRIWDTAGSEKFRSITNAYYKDCACALIVYDISSKQSFLSIKDWVRECIESSPETVLLVLVGNKCDLNENREVQTSEGEDFAKENNMLFFETSAMTGENIEEMFLETLKNIRQKIKDSYYDNRLHLVGIKGNLSNNVINNVSLSKTINLKSQNSCPC